MTKPYRSKEGIYRQILTAIKENEPDTRITKLIFLSNLTGFQLNRHLQTLIEIGLVTRDTSKSKLAAASEHRPQRQHYRGDRFHITRKGLEYLRMVEEIHHALPTAGIHI
jgi:predicted transcriptional regulator